jgi:alkylated DNA repair dioxygenase AlkB
MIEGLSYIPSFLDADEQQTLLMQLEQLSYYHGSTGRTLTPAAPFPPFLTDLMERGCSVCLDPDPFNQCIITCYDAGSAIGWHTDAATFGDVIFGISVGASARLQFRAGKTAAVEFELGVQSGSLYCIWVSLLYARCGSLEVPAPCAARHGHSLLFDVSHRS